MTALNFPAPPPPPIIVVADANQLLEGYPARASWVDHGSIMLPLYTLQPINP